MRDLRLYSHYKISATHLFFYYTLPTFHYYLAWLKHQHRRSYTRIYS
ncbi:hypothetical protein HMPREF0880_03322 [Yokenella regensburgei ATCC 43003]|nr:hypothetical protein HMPREF0880_03322 [Yokenella regensburgei ATCC 43003]